jgi:hypothetical protein
MNTIKNIAKWLFIRISVAFKVGVYFFAIVGALWFYHNWKEVVIKPFVNETKIINLEVDAVKYSPIPKK